ncbi:MAG: PEP-CTERM sorting domain-containing protein [Verrucomicrobiota bacterium]
MNRSIVFFATFLFVRLAVAQGTFELVALNTGAGQPLISEMRTLLVDAALNQPRLLFKFGFATEENPLPGEFLDSFTVSIQDPSGTSTAVYLTADANGLVFAPATPGTIAVDPATIFTSVIAYPSLQPLLPNQRAFQLSAPIPSQFSGGSVRVFFDLFDNLNPLASQAWFSDLQVVAVPEPRTVGMLIFGALAFFWRFKRGTQ